MIGAGKLETRKAGARPLVVTESLRRWANGLPPAWLPRRCHPTRSRRAGPRATEASAPPHRLTFITEPAVTSLLERAGLERIEVTTPRQLDVDIVHGVLSEQPDALAEVFTLFMTRFTSDRQRGALLRFLSVRGRSSHMWSRARRPCDRNSRSVHSTRK